MMQTDHEYIGELYDYFDAAFLKLFLKNGAICERDEWRKRSIPTHSGWLYPLTFDAGKGLKEA